MSIKILRNTYLGFIFISFLGFSQEIIYDKKIEKLTSLEFSNLSNLYYKFINSEKDQANVYAQAYLAKSKDKNDNLNKIKGYRMVGVSLGNNKGLKFLDSALVLAKENFLHSWYEGFISYDKGTILYNKRKFKKAIDNFILANKEARRFNFSDLLYDSNYMIAILTDRIGNHYDAIKIHQEFLNNNRGHKIGKKDSIRYLRTLFGLAVAQYKLHNYDSSRYYNDNGLESSLLSNNKEYYNYFTLSTAINYYQDGDYSYALDYIDKSIKYFDSINNLPNLAVCFFYKGKIYIETDRTLVGLDYLKRVDTIFQYQKDILPEMRESYQILIDHYKSSGKSDQELTYTKKLLQVDSVLNSNYKYLQTNIIKDYYTPILLDKEIQSTSKNFKLIVYSVSSLVILLIVAFIHQKKKNLKYQIKFEELISGDKQEYNNQDDSVKNEVGNYLNIPEEIVNEVMQGLLKFEQECLYIESTYTLSKLAKQLNTNSTYLSKIINTYKDKSFSSYINDLRVDFIIDKLKNEKKYRLFSVKALSEESGFKSSESFSKAFYRKTQIYPSFFIKQLNKKGLDL